jgi:hypothetical protein
LHTNKILWVNVPDVIFIDDLYIFPLIYTRDNIYYQATSVILHNITAFYYVVIMMSPYQIFNKHTIVDMFCPKWISHRISHSQVLMWYCSEKSILAKQINNSIHIYIWVLMVIHVYYAHHIYGSTYRKTDVQHDMTILCIKILYTI